MSEAVISIRNLYKQYKDFTLDIPSLDIEKGFITGFIGENGAGKTTALRLIMDEIIAERGEITVMGNQIATNPLIKEQIGYVSSTPAFSSMFKLKQVRSIIAPFFPTWDDELFQSYMTRFGLNVNNKVKTLSSGKLKLFSLAVALSHRPKLLILDEPTSNLDPVVRSEILELFSELLLTGDTSILYSTHITSDLDKTADYIVYIHGGKILFQEEKDQLLAQCVVIKGDNEILRQNPDCPLIGIKETSVGFSALCTDRAKAQQVLGDRVVMENPNIEDIMIYAAKEEHFHG